ncbi:hypothetical protein NUACC26_027380 [Scytonema sp. NUACC26]
MLEAQGSYVVKGMNVYGNTMGLRPTTHLRPLTSDMVVARTES